MQLPTEIRINRMNMKVIDTHIYELHSDLYLRGCLFRFFIISQDAEPEKMQL